MLKDEVVGMIFVLVVTALAVNLFVGVASMPEFAAALGGPASWAGSNAQAIGILAAVVTGVAGLVLNFALFTKDIEDGGDRLESLGWVAGRVARDVVKWIAIAAAVVSGAFLIGVGAFSAKALLVL